MWYWLHRQHDHKTVGLSDQGIFVAGECKYTTRQMTKGDLSGVEDAAPHVDWTSLGGGDPEYEHCCFCRLGVSNDLKTTVEGRDDVHLFTTDVVVTALTTGGDGRRQ